MSSSRHYVLFGLLTSTFLSTNAFASDPLSNTILPASPFDNGTDDIPMSGRWLSPEYKWFFEYPLPIMPTKEVNL